jgi:hypothetical protein
MPKPEWWRDQSIMGVLGQVKPMSANMPETPLRNTQGIGPVAGTVEEGEYVMDKPIVDAVGPQALESLRSKIRSGTITKDQLDQLGRGGVGSPSYKCGGMVKRYAGGGLVKNYQVGGLVTQKNYTDALSQGPILSQTPQAPTNQLGAAPVGPTFGTDYRSTTGAGLGGTPTFGADFQQTPTAQRLPSAQPPPQIGGVASAPGGGTAGVAPFTGVPAEPPETAGVVDDIPPTVPAAGVPSMEARARGIGMGGLEQIAAGEHPLFRTLANMAQQQIAAQGAMDTAAMKQQMAQMGVTGGAANAMLADIQRDIGSQQAMAAAETAVNAQSMAMKASEALATQGLQGMQFEYRQNQNALNNLLEAGDLDGYAQAFENVYGMPVDTTMLADEQRTKQLANGMQTVTTLMATNPNITADDPLMQNALGTVWKSMGKTGPIDGEWASKFIGDMKLASDPMYQLLGGVTEQGANEFFGEDFVNQFEYTDANGNTMTGWPALRKELGRIKLSGGFSYDAEKGWEFDDTNPLVQNLYGKYSAVTTPEAAGPTPLLTTAEGDEYMVGDDGFITVDGEKVQYGDNFIKQDENSPTGYSAGGKFITLNPETGTPKTITYASFKGDNPNTQLNQDQFIQFLSQEPASLDIINDWIAGPLGSQITASVTGILGGEEVYGQVAQTTATVKILADIKPKIDAFLKEAGVSEAAKTVIMQNIEEPLKKEIENRIGG